MNLENRTAQARETEFKCPLDDYELIYNPINFNISGGQWNFYFCPYCKAVYDRTNKEYLTEKAKKHLLLLQEMEKKDINVIIKPERIREIIKLAKSRELI